MWRWVDNMAGTEDQAQHTPLALAGTPAWPASIGCACPAEAAPTQPSLSAGSPSSHVCPHFHSPQGCMNNFTFGDEGMGYYETIAGGAGAGPGWHGRRCAAAG